MAGKAKPQPPPTAAELAAQIQELEAERASIDDRRTALEAQLAGQWRDPKARDELTAEFARLTNEASAISGALDQLRAAHGAAEQREIEAQRHAIEAEREKRLAHLKELVKERDQRRAAYLEAEREVTRADARVRDASDQLRLFDRRRRQ